MSKKSIRRVATITACILLIPLFGNYLVDGWNWDAIDFFFAAIMFFVAGCALEVVFTKIRSTTYRIIATLIIVVTFIAIWIELATGIF